MSIEYYSVLFSLTLFTLMLSIYLIFAWINHRKHFKGIGVFILGMMMISTGYASFFLKNTIPEFVFVTVPNFFLIGGFAIYLISLYLFFGEKIGLVRKTLLAGIMVVFFIEQFVFFYLMPNLTVRIISFTVVVLIIDFLSIVLLIKKRKVISLTGYFLLSGLIFQFIAFMARIPLSIVNPVADSILNIGGVHLFILISSIFISSTWPIGFSLLISFRFQKMESLEKKEKEILLQELYHRTNNNMQVIMSFISLQQEYLESEETKYQLQLINNRIQTMSLVQKKLYDSKNLSSLNLKEYLTELTELLIESFEVDKNDIRMKVSVENIVVAVDVAIPVGLVINELITNSFKHGFPDGKGTIELNVHTEDNKIFLKVKDDGAGLKKDFDFNKAERLGIQTVIRIVEIQLSGKIRFESEKGLACYMEFPKGPPAP